MNQRYVVCGIIQRGDEIILGKKAKGVPPYPDVWHTPGGGADDADAARTLCDAGDFDGDYFHGELKREMKEELGVDIANIRNIVPEFRSELRQWETPDKHGHMTHYFFLEYLCGYAGGTLEAGDDLAEAKWVKKHNLKNVSLTPPSREMYRELGWIRD